MIRSAILADRAHPVGPFLYPACFRIIPSGNSAVVCPPRFMKIGRPVHPVLAAEQPHIKALFQQQLAQLPGGVIFPFAVGAASQVRPVEFIIYLEFGSRSCQAKLAGQRRSGISGDQPDGFRFISRQGERKNHS